MIQGDSSVLLLSVVWLVWMPYRMLKWALVKIVNIGVDER